MVASHRWEKGISGLYYITHYKSPSKIEGICLIFNIEPKPATGKT
jgi:hypothetical protein